MGQELWTGVMVSDPERTGQEELRAWVAGQGASRALLGSEGVSRQRRCPHSKALQHKQEAGE